jgi:hypothetical protein
LSFNQEQIENWIISTKVVSGNLSKERLLARAADYLFKLLRTWKNAPNIGDLKIGSANVRCRFAL